MPIKDPEKRRDYNRRYYQLTDKKRQTLRVKQRKRKLREAFNAWKATKTCLHCGETDSICLEFHHVDPRTKDAEPSMMIEAKGWSIERIIEYLEQYCLCLCSNCHKKVHRELRKFHKKLNEPTARTPARKSSRKLLPRTRRIGKAQPG
jgi:transcription elongation factor Elf1